jgi:hypothetical protein
MRAGSLLTLAVMTVGLVGLPGAPTAATCQSWGGRPPSIGDEWSTLHDVAVITPCRAFAVGTYRNAGSERALIERWNGERWSIVDLPDFGVTHDGLQGVAAAATNDVWAVGAALTGAFADRPLILRWQGGPWTRIPAPATGESKLYAVDVVAADDVWAVGQRHDDADVEQPLIERWNGRRWKVVPTPELPAGGALYAVDASGPNVAWAVGRREVGGQLVPLTMRWNGTTWRVVPAPTIDDTDYHELHGVATISRTRAWAVGNSGGMGNRDLLFRWNGSAWKVVPHPEGEGDGQLAAIEATAPRNVWAVGVACDLSDRCDSRVLHFDGSGWTVLPSATLGDGSQFNGIGASSSTDVWAVGSTSAPSTFTPFAVHCC